MSWHGNHSRSSGWNVSAMENWTGGFARPIPLGSQGRPQSPPSAYFEPLDANNRYNVGLPGPGSVRPGSGVRRPRSALPGLNLANGGITGRGVNGARTTYSPNSSRGTRPKSSRSPTKSPGPGDLFALGKERRDELLEQYAADAITRAYKLERMIEALEAENLRLRSRKEKKNETGETAVFNAAHAQLLTVRLRDQKRKLVELEKLLLEKTRQVAEMEKRRHEEREKLLMSQKSMQKERETEQDEKLTALERRLRQAEADLRKERAERERLEQASGRQKAGAANLEEEIKRLTEELERSGREAADARRRSTEENDEYLEVDERIRKLEGALKLDSTPLGTPRTLDDGDEMSTRMAMARKDVKATEAELLELLKSLKKKDEIDKAGSAVHASALARASALSTNAALESANGALSTEEARLHALNAELQAANEALKRNPDDPNAKKLIEWLGRQIADLEDERRALLDRLKQLQEDAARGPKPGEEFDVAEVVDADQNLGEGEAGLFARLDESSAPLSASERQALYLRIATVADMIKRLELEKTRRDNAMMGTITAKKAFLARGKIGKPSKPDVPRLSGPAALLANIGETAVHAIQDDTVYGKLSKSLQNHARAVSDMQRMATKLVSLQERLKKTRLRKEELEKQIAREGKSASKESLEMLEKVTKEEARRLVEVQAVESEITENARQEMNVKRNVLRVGIMDLDKQRKLYDQLKHAAEKVHWTAHLVWPPQKTKGIYGNTKLVRRDDVKLHVENTYYSMLRYFEIDHSAGGSIALDARRPKGSILFSQSACVPCKNRSTHLTLNPIQTKKRT